MRENVHMMDGDNVVLLTGEQVQLVSKVPKTRSFEAKSTASVSMDNLSPAT